MPANVSDIADYVVVGSGAGGATVASVLARAGMDVVVVEEGPRFPMEERTVSAAATMSRVFRGGGLTTTFGRPIIPYLQGRCVGGTTVVNSAIARRMSEETFNRWLQIDPKIGSCIAFDDLDQCFSTIEREIGIEKVDWEVAGRVSELAMEGSARMGWQGQRTDRFMRGCKGLGRCFQGCPIGAKQSMDLTYLPQAESKGARIYPSQKVERILIDGKRHATGVLASSTDQASAKDRHRLEVHARKGVVICAGAVNSPALLARNGIGGRSIGRRTMLHPSMSIAAAFDESVNPWSGATQGFEVTHFLDRGMKIESILLPPEYLATGLMGIGRGFADKLASSGSIATIGAYFRSTTPGRIRVFGRFGVTVSYSLSKQDVELAHFTLHAMSKVMRAAGARSILPVVRGWPHELEASSAPEWIEKNRPSASDLKMAVTHLMGGAAMGSDHRRSVVSPSLEVHGIKGLYVADASVFPDNIGVNPQHTIMALAMAAARHWLDREM